MQERVKEQILTEVDISVEGLELEQAQTTSHFDIEQRQAAIRSVWHRPKPISEVFRECPNASENDCKRIKE